MLSIVTAVLTIQRCFRHAMFKRRVALFVVRCKELNRRIKLIQMWWRETRRIRIATKWVQGMKARRLMATVEFKRKRLRIKDIEDEIIESTDRSWTALMFKELYKAKVACSQWLHLALERRDWVSYGQKTSIQLRE
jgi:hypothetical protein